MIWKRRFTLRHCLWNKRIIHAGIWIFIYHFFIVNLGWILLFNYQFIESTFSKNVFYLWSFRTDNKRLCEQPNQDFDLPLIVCFCEKCYCWREHDSCESFFQCLNKTACAEEHLAMQWHLRFLPILMIAWKVRTESWQCSSVRLNQQMEWT